MSRTLLLPAAMLSVAFVLGCGDAPRLTGPADPPGPSLRAERFVHLDAFQMGGDPSNPLALQAGFDAGVTAEEICADPESQNPNGVGQVVITPVGGVHIHTKGRDVNLVVYQFGAGPVAGPCDLVGAPVVGTGTGNFTFNLQDTGPGAVVIHASVRGRIDLVTGGQARLHATARVTILPDDTLRFDVERVRLTPL